MDVYSASALGGSKAVVPMIDKGGRQAMADVVVLVGSDGNPPTGPIGTSFTDKSVAALTANQAAGTDMVLPANPTRRVFAITPTNDGRLYIASAAGAGFYWPLYAGVTRVLSGADCPTNALFVTGQTAGTALPMAEG